MRDPRCVYPNQVVRKAHALALTWTCLPQMTRLGIVLRSGGLDEVLDDLGSEWSWKINGVGDSGT